MFYQFLLGAALALNLGNRKMLALTSVVGVGVFIPVPVPHDIFYLVCMAGEIIIGLFAVGINTNASGAIFRISIVLAILHWLGHSLGGYPVSSPYHVLVKIAEHAELLACIVLSHKFINKANNAE